MSRESDQDIPMQYDQLTPKVKKFSHIFILMLNIKKDIFSSFLSLLVVGVMLGVVSHKDKQVCCT